MGVGVSLWRGGVGGGGCSVRRKLVIHIESMCERTFLAQSCVIRSAGIRSTFEWLIGNWNSSRKCLHLYRREIADSRIS